jgi:glycosyltransferase involved in cell wall biosynthesis
MKIIVAASFGPSLTNFRGDFIKEMVRAGNEVTCISIESKEDMAENIKKLGADYISTGGSRTGTGLLENLLLFWKYIKILKRIQPDICFLYMAKPIVFGGIASIILRVKKIYPFVTGLETAFYSKGIDNFLIRRILCSFYRVIFYFSKVIFFMNQDDYDKMIYMKLIKSGKGVLVNGSGVNMNYFTRLPLPEEACILMTARLVEGKGIREYFKAASKLKEKYQQVEFLLVGGLDEHKEAISEKELKHLLKEGTVTYCGYAEDVRPYLKRCSIFVLPSYHEGNGKSIVEAMAAGRPVVTTNAPGCKDTVIDGYNGYLVKVGDSEELAKGLEVLIQNRELREVMGEYSFQLCKEKFEVNHINKILLTQMGLQKN